MAEPVITKLFSASMGDHEDINIVALPDWFSPSDSQNLRMDKLGEIRKIAGFTAANSSAVTTDTGGAATEVHALFEYWAGASTPEIIGIFFDTSLYDTSFTAGDEYEIHKSTNQGSSWSFLKDMGQHGTPAATDFDPIPTAFEYNDVLYIAIKGEAAQQYDGSSVTDAGPTQSPTPSLSASATAGKPSGTYAVRLVSMIDDDRQAGSAVSSQVQLDSKQGDVTWTADSNTNVTGYEIYATTGTGKEFYFVGYEDGRTTTSFTLDLSDAEIRRGRPLDRHGDAPTSGVSICALHKNRGWWARTAANPERLYFSDPFQPDEVSPNSFFDVVGKAKGADEITALEGGYFNSLVVFKRDAIFRVTGTGEYIGGVPDFTVRETNAQLGAVSTQCVVRVPAGAKYVTEDGTIASTGQVTLAFWAPDNTIRLFDGDSDSIISHPKSEYLDSAAGRLEQWHYVAEHDEDNQEISWFFTDTSANNPNENYLGVTWNYKRGVWTELSNTPFSCSVTTVDSSGDQLLLCGSNGDGAGTGSADGTVYINKSGTDYNGTGNDITAEYWTKPLPLTGLDGVSAIGKTKRLRRLRLVTDAQGATQNLTVEWYDDYADSGATAAGSATVDMNESNKSHGQNKIIMKDSSGDYLLSKAPRLRFYDTADDAAWAMPGFELSYQVLEGEKGR